MDNGNPQKYPTYKMKLPADALLCDSQSYYLFVKAL